MPNEIDFAFNTLLLLSSDEYHAFKVYNSPRLIGLMLAHIGFFGMRQSSNTSELVKSGNYGKIGNSSKKLCTSNYRNLYDNVWHATTDEDHADEKINSDCLMTMTISTFNNINNKPKRRNFVKFWHNAVQLPEQPYLKNLIENLLPELYNKCK